MSETEWRGFSNNWHFVYRRIYAIRLVRTGFSAIGEPDPYRGKTTRQVSPMFGRFVAASVGIPLLTIVGACIVGPSQDLSVVLVVCGLSVSLNAGMLGAASVAWEYALGRSEHIDDLLQASPSEQRDRAVDFLSDAVSFRYQILLSAAMATIPIVVMIANRNSPEWWSISSCFLAACLTYTMFLLGNVSYWLLVPPFVAVRLLLTDNVSLRWNDPARTPGIRVLSEGYAGPAGFLVFGALGLSVYGFFASSTVGPFLPFAYGWLAFLSLWVFGIPHTALYFMVRNYKYRILDLLARESDIHYRGGDDARLPRKLKQDDDLRGVLDMYGLVAQTQLLTIGTPVIIQYAAALAGSFAAFLLGS